MGFGLLKYIDNNVLKHGPKVWLFQFNFAILLYRINKIRYSKFVQNLHGCDLHNYITFGEEIRLRHILSYSATTFPNMLAKI